MARGNGAAKLIDPAIAELRHALQKQQQAIHDLQRSHVLQKQCADDLAEVKTMLRILLHALIAETHGRAAAARAAEEYLQK